MIERASERYGLDDPIFVQFINYWKRVLRWDLGESFVNGRSVNDILGEKAPRSIRLAIWATLIEIIVGISVGLISAIRRYSITDKLTTIGTAAGGGDPGVRARASSSSTPSPSTPTSTTGRSGCSCARPRLGPDTWWAFFVPTGEQWRYLILPAITLACVSTALAARMMRGSMLEVMRADYMRTAKSKGLSRALGRHAPWPAQRPDPRRHADRHRLRHRHRRRHPHRDRVLVARASVRRSPTRSASATCP